jgi:hypothetical protein
MVCGQDYYQSGIPLQLECTILVSLNHALNLNRLSEIGANLFSIINENL